LLVPVAVVAEEGALELAVLEVEEGVGRGEVPGGVVVVLGGVELVEVVIFEVVVVLGCVEVLVFISVACKIAGVASTEIVVKPL
jgi:hypothetical protein